MARLALLRERVRAMAARALRLGGSALLCLAPFAQAVALEDRAPALATALVSSSSHARANGYDGVVEAVRQTMLAAQISGRVVAVQVKVGERVKPGQVLIRLDARAVQQQANAAAAQGQAARAAQAAAVKDLQRQQQLFKKNYISQAALDRAEMEFQVAQAQASGQLAAARAAHTTSGFYVVTAPYAGIVSHVAVVLGDMALPGRALVTVYDPSALRVTASVPQGMVPHSGSGNGIAPLAELPSAAAGMIQPVRWQVLPVVDAATHTVELRLDLPASTAVAPGTFARVWLAGAAQGNARFWIPAQAVVRRAELTSVYVVNGQGRPLLRQVRLGPVHGEQIEVLTGLNAGERVVLDPQAAARVR